MLSSKLIQLIEDHWDPITTRILNDIRQDPRLRQVGSLPESDLRERGREILERLGDWLSSAREAELARRFEAIGGVRYAESIPLSEVVLSYMLIKERMLQFVRGQGIGETPMALYAEEELEHRVGRFFDSMSYYVIRGYEQALAEAARAPAARAKRASARG